MKLLIIDPVTAKQQMGEVYRPQQED